MTRSFGQDWDTAFAELPSSASDLTSELAAATKQMQEMDAEVRRLSRSMSSSLRTAFDRAIFGGKGLGDVLRGLARDAASRGLNAALRPVTDAFGSALTGAFGSLGGAVSGVLGFANGGAFSAGRVRAFAKGGVVDGPMTFPMRGGTGLMGEAGPEAIMPLTRGADGRLGVRAEGAGRGAAITVNIHTQDVESFRRSRGQVAAQLARAVARGNRQL